jgi:hypothetical protein
MAIDFASVAAFLPSDQIDIPSEIRDDSALQVRDQPPIRRRTAVVAKSAAPNGIDV